MGKLSLVRRWIATHYLLVGFRWENINTVKYITRKSTAKAATFILPFKFHTNPTYTDFQCNIWMISCEADVYVLPSAMIDTRWVYDFMPSWSQTRGLKLFVWKAVFPRYISESCHGRAGGERYLCGINGPCTVDRAVGPNEALIFQNVVRNEKGPRFKMVRKWMSAKTHMNIPWIRFTNRIS